MSYTIPKDALIFSDAKIGPIENIVDTTYNEECSKCMVGAYIYRSSCTFTNYIRDAIEPNEGAHYYLQTAERTNLYNESFVVDLSKVEIDPKGTRRGFISLSFVSNGFNIHQCDIGIACDTATNMRGKWYPTCWCRDFLAKDAEGNDIIAAYPPSANNKVHVEEGSTKYFIPDNRKVRITLAVERNQNEEMDIIYGTFVDVDNGTLYGDILFKVPYGTAFPVGLSMPMLRFERFISFVPLVNMPDNRDFSRLIATIYDCKINGSAWTDSTSDIEHCWSCQGANIVTLRPSTLAYDPSSHMSKDEIEIYHQYQLH